MVSISDMSDERLEHEIAVLTETMRELDITPMRADKILRSYMANLTSARERYHIKKAQGQTAEQRPRRSTRYGTVAQRADQIARIQAGDLDYSIRPDSAQHGSQSSSGSDEDKAQTSPG